jgi:CRP-like cAMP-binding protein
LLAALPAAALSAVSPHLKTIALKFGDVLAQPNGAVRHVYFPYDGVISLVVDLSNGMMIETALVGRDGVLNGTSALDGKKTFNKGIVQVSGKAGVMHVDRLRKLADEIAPLRSLLIRHDQMLFAQAQQSAACNASHKIEQRMCRWLLQMRDLADSDRIALTQDFLARMLGAHRPSVSLAASTLQKAKLLRYSRGNMQLLDIKGLQKASCECYATVRALYQRLYSD